MYEKGNRDLLEREIREIKRSWKERKIE